VSLEIPSPEKVVTVEMKLQFLANTKEHKQDFAKVEDIEDFA
jgi:hypothetical protein